ncbi:MAG: PAS domain S-box protein [Desulfuromonadaceae bacterium]
MKSVISLLRYGLFSAIVTGFLMVGAFDLHAEPGSSKKILLLNSYHAGYKGSDDIVLGFKETLRRSFPNAETVIEYLDSKHFIGPEFDSRVLDTLTFKYRKQPYDLIVSTDDYAFNTLEPHRDRLFGQTPVVFCGTNNFDRERIKNRPDFIGVDESPSFTETLELMFSLHPGTRKIIAIHDDSVTGQLNSADFRKRASHFETRATFTYLSGKKLEELLHEVGRLTPGTLVVYFASFIPDNTGKRLSSIAALQMISKASTVPIYGGWEFNLGHGIVGGRLINLREHGKAAADLAVKVLQGQSPSSLAPLQLSPNRFMFDYAELKRFAISESGLPPGSEIINRPPTFFSRKSTVLLSLLSASLLLLVVIIFTKLLTSNRKLTQSHIKFSSMVEAFDGLMYVCSPQCRIEFMNERMIQRTGYDATGDLCYKALHGLDSVCPWCKNDRVFAGENIQWDVLSPQDNRWYNVSNTLVRNADGTVSKQAMITDITARIETAEKLRRSEERYRSLFSGATDGIFILSPDGTLLEINESFARMHGYSVAEMLQMTLYDLDTPEGLLRIPERMQRILSGESVTFEVEHYHKDGHIFPLEVTASLIAPGGEPAVICFHRDISERKRFEEEKQTLEQQFQKTQRLESLGVLAGGIAHDFNNILTAIIGYCSLIEMDYKKADVHIPQIVNAAERAARLCRQMLAYAGKSQFIQTRVNIETKVSETAKMLKTTLPHNVTITFDSAPDIPLIKADASQISQLAMYFIINASEAVGDAQGEVSVSLSKAEISAGQAEQDYFGKVIPTGRYVCLEFRDNGCGMSEETYHRIFEPFYTTKFIGRGLGMSAALGIITSHKGALQLSSRPGHGTTFKVFLPIETIEEALT